MRIFRLENYSLNGLYLILVLLAAILSTIIIVGTLVRSLSPSLNEFQKKEQRIELEISQNFLTNFLKNQAISYRDLAKLPIVIQTVMGGIENEPNLLDFLKDYRVLGSVDPLVILDINLKKLIQRGDFEIDVDSFLKRESDRLHAVIDGESPKLLRIELASGHYVMVLAVPVVYAGFNEGLLMVELELSHSPVLEALELGLDKTMVVKQGEIAFSNNIPYGQILENPSDYSELSVDIELYNISLHYFQDRSAFEREKRKTILKVCGSLFLGILIFSILLYLLGKKLILEPTKRIEDSEKEQRLFRAIIENTNDAVVITEADQIDGPNHPAIAYVNSAFTDISGYSPEEVVGKTPRMLQGDQTEDQTRAEILEALKNKESYNGELLNYTKDGRPYWIEINIFPIRNNRGELIYFGAVERDITERKEFLEKIETTSQRLSLATESAQIGVWDWDIKEGSLHWSPEMWPLYEVDREVEPSYEVWNACLHPEDRTMSELAIEKALNGEEDFNITFRILTSSGEVKHVRGLAQVVRNEHSEAIKMVGVNYDVTSQVEYQEAMALAKSKAEEASRMKSEFLANMSHEIRTPMNGVIGAANILREMKLGEDEQRLVQTICTSGDSLLILINDILDLSKIEADKMELEHQPFSPAELMDEMGDLFRLRAEEKSLSLDIQIGEEVPALVMGDRARLWQVLTNLMGNAFKFTEEGSIKLSVHCLPSEGQYLNFSIKDTGIGIPKDKQDGLFDSFSQVDASITRKFGGSGLGLAIAKRLVEMMQGKLGLESEVNVGSKFWFQIPLEVANEQVISDKNLRDPEELGEQDQGLKGKILVCEDNKTNIEVLKAMLGQAGEFNISICNNGKEGLKRSHEEKFDIVLMDVQMPIMDGLMATEMIRSQSALNAQTAIIALTANALSGDREICLEAGMDDYLPKPILPNSLRACLRKWLGVPSKSQGEGGRIQDAEHEKDEPARTLEKEMPVLSREDLLARLMGDQSLAKMVLEGFREESEVLLSHLTSSLESGDLKQSSIHAHTLKGATANISAESLRHLFAELEKVLASGKTTEVEGLMKEISAGMVLLRQEIEKALQEIS